MTYERERIDGWVDVTSCFDSGSAHGRAILSFITQTECRQLDESVLVACLDYLRSIASERDGRQWVPHPADMFHIA